MSVLEQTTSTSKSPRRIPSTVRLGTEVMNELCTHLGVGEVRADNSQCVAGLLFGIAEHDVLSVKALKAFPAPSSAENGSPEYVEIAFERYLATAQTDPEIASLHLVGWYGMRRPDEIATLSDSDVEFHNRRFRRATDIAVILKPKQHAGASMDSIELYGRSFLKTAISRRDYRTGSLLPGVAPHVNAPSDVAMRESVQADYDLNVFQVLESIDRAEKKGPWKRIALGLKAITPLSLRPEWMTTLADAAGETSAGTSVRVNPSPSSVGSAPAKLRGSLAVLVALAIGVAIAWRYGRPFFSALPRKALFHLVPASTPLNMRVEPQVGGALLVRWDAHSPAARAAKNGTMQIDDGSERHDLRLDSNQIANGSILYTPVSRDLTFRLEVFEGNRKPISESMRVVNGSKVKFAAHAVRNERSNTSAKTSSGSTKKRGSQPSFGRSRTVASTVTPGSSPRIPEAERKRQTPRSRTATPPAGSPATDSPATETKSSSGTQELHNTLEKLPMQSPAGPLQPASINNSTSARYVPSRPLKQVMPSAINLTSTALSRATDIEVQVRIDEEGRVTEARVVNNRYDNNGLLTSAALMAAKEWIFEPAKMYGKSVPSDHMIKFRFHPAK